MTINPAKLNNIERCATARALPKRARAAPKRGAGGGGKSNLRGLIIVPLLKIQNISEKRSWPVSRLRHQRQPNHRSISRKYRS